MPAGELTVLVYTNNCADSSESTLSSICQCCNKSKCAGQCWAKVFKMHCCPCLDAWRITIYAAIAQLVEGMPCHPLVALPIPILYRYDASYFENLNWTKALMQCQGSEKINVGNIAGFECSTTITTRIPSTHQSHHWWMAYSPSTFLMAVAHSSWWLTCLAPSKMNAAFSRLLSYGILMRTMLSS